MTGRLKAPIDILFVGGGAYAWDLDKNLKEWLENLTPDCVKAIAPFSTSGGFDGVKRIAKIAREKGIVVLEHLPLRVLGRNHAAFVKMVP
jgi:hypothetical protein